MNFIQLGAHTVKMLIRGIALELGITVKSAAPTNHFVISYGVLTSYTGPLLS